MSGMLTRRAPFANLPFQIFDEFLREPFIANLSTDLDEGTLAVDVSEDEKSVIVRASLPGFDRKDVEIEVHDGVLSVKAQHTEESEEAGEKFYRKERRFGSVSRRIALPSAVDEGRAKAELNNGVLTVRVAKSEQAMPRKVSID